MDQLLGVLTTSAAAAVALVATLSIAIGALWVLISSSEHRTLCMGYLLVGFLVQTFVLEQPYITLGLQLYIDDFISMLMMASIAISFLRRPLPVGEPAFLAWSGFGVIMLVSFVIGTMAYGTAAGTELRPNFYFWVAGLYCCTAEFDEKDIRRLARWFLWGAYALIGIAMYRWIGVQAGFLPAHLVFAGYVGDFRPVGSHTAFYLAAAGLVQLLAWIRGTGTRWSGWHAVAMGAAVLVLQHRSVWFAYAVGVAFLIVLERRHMPRRFPWALGFGLAAGIAIGIAAAFGLLDSLFERLEESILTMGDSRSTFSDRVFGWYALIDEWFAASLKVQLFGYPYGYGFRRVVEGIVVDYAPHNFYVEMLLRVGLVGTLLMLAAMVAGLVSGVVTRAQTESDYLLTRGLAVVIVAAFVYFLAYQSYHLQGAIVGLALAQIIRYRRMRNPQPAPPSGTGLGRLDRGAVR